LIEFRVSEKHSESDNHNVHRRTGVCGMVSVFRWLWAGFT